MEDLEKKIRIVEKKLETASSARELRELKHELESYDNEWLSLARELEQQKVEESNGDIKSSSSSSSSSSPTSLASFKQLSWSSFKGLQKIGEGAYALVHEALLNGERVAVKEVKGVGAEADEAYVQHVNEVRVMSSLCSGYVVHMYGASLDRCKPFVAMEFVPRGTLFDYLASEAEIDWARRWELARDVALGLNYLHSLSPALLHRDLKSHNLLLDVAYRVKLCDFGLAVPAEPAPEPIACGTPRWSAPEVNAETSPYTTKADIYSFGIVLWEIAVRKVVWGNEFTEAIVSMVAAGKRPDIPDDVPAEFATLIRACWHPAPERRPSIASVVRKFEKRGLLDNKVRESVGELARVKHEHDELKREHDIQLQVRDTLERRVATADRDLQTALNEQRQATRAAEELESRVRKERDRVRELEKDVGAARRDADQANLSVDKLKRKLAKRGKAAQKAEQTLKRQFERRIDELERDAARAKRDLDRERREREHAEETLARMQQRRSQK
jgi:serine/threonine protein kinase